MDLVNTSTKLEFSFSEISIAIIAKVWYPVNYYKLALGKQDQLAKLCIELKEYYSIKEDISERDLITFLTLHIDDNFLSIVSSKITKYVPYRFLRPWFSNELRGIKDGKVNQTIIDIQETKSHELPYLIHNNSISITPTCEQWLKEQYELVSSFTLYKLFAYIEKNNPNTTGLTIKLFKPQARNLTAATKLWKSYIAANNDFPCIFDSHQSISPSSLSIDHFLPWSFCTHDQLWNLHPVSKSINSSKSNCLPDLKYLDDFIYLQYDFSKFLWLEKKNKALEDYITLFKTDSLDLSSWTKNKFTSSFKEVYSPQFEIAENMGYIKGWSL